MSPVRKASPQENREASPQENRPPSPASDAEDPGGRDFPVQFTVAIPTYNGADRLPPLLERLRSQQLPDGFLWEILVVDNNSTDATAEVVQRYQSDWVTCPLHYARERRQGAAFARQRAMRLARGEWVGFLDDDNWPEPNWVAAAHAFGQGRSRAGAVAGRLHGAYEVPPPADFEVIEGFLAVRPYADFGDRPARFDAANLRLPPAAALAVRRRAWLESVPPRPRLSGKVPGRLVQGDDYEPLLYLHRAGWEIWYCPELLTHHQIPAWRLRRDYLLELARGCGLATYSLRAINASGAALPLTFARTFLGNLRKAAARAFAQRLRRRIAPRRTLDRDLNAAVELSFFWGAALSPWYALLASWRGARNRRSRSVSPGESRSAAAGDRRSRRGAAASGPPSPPSHSRSAGESPPVSAAGESAPRETPGSARQ